MLEDLNRGRKVERGARLVALEAAGEQVLRVARALWYSGSFAHHPGQYSVATGPVEEPTVA